MEYILKQMTGEELLLMRILGDKKMAGEINTELDHRARTCVKAPIIARAEYETIRTTISASARLAA